MAKKTAPARRPPTAPHRKAKTERRRQSTRNRPPHPGEAEAIAARREQVLALRKAGLSYRAIAREVGVSVETAWADVQAELSSLNSLTAEHAEDVLSLEMRRLDDLQVHVTNLIRAGATPRVIDTAIRLMERRAKMIGMDAPAKKQISGPDGMPLGGGGVTSQMLEEREAFLIVKMDELLANVEKRLREDAAKATT
jgi:DNA-binding CsgD family transcriptional regulator